MLDKIEITVQGGRGGAGTASFHREKFITKGGPDGGDGGRGGRIFLEAVDDIYTLEDFRQKRSFSAEKGGDGGIRQRTGKQGKDLSLAVPVGTLVYDQEDGALLADLTEVGARALVAHGGRGGWGNRKFATSTNQSPRYAQQGHSGEKVSLLLDLALLADVGLIGLPNAGKSTFLSVISQAKPKIAAYPFTTLAPVLGVVGEGAERFTIADLPGLVEGAHEGVGLGLDFLKHVKRCRVLVHLVDGNELDPAVATRLVEAEVLSYDPLLSDLLRIVVVTKADINAAVCEQAAALLREAGHEVVCVISAKADTGTRALVQLMCEEVVRARKEQRARAMAMLPVIRPAAAERFTIKNKGKGKFEVEGIGPVRFVEMMDLEEDGAREEVLRRLERWGVSKALRSAGATAGDSIGFGESLIVWE